MALTIAGAPIFVVRGQDGALRGFHNTCRHRGSRIVPDGKGAAARLVCPYHRWTYDLSGELVHAARMGDDFEACDHGLHPIARRDLRRRRSMSAWPTTPPDFAPFRAALEPLLAPHRSARRQARLREQP